MWDPVLKRSHVSRPHGEPLKQKEPGMMIAVQQLPDHAQPQHGADVMPGGDVTRHDDVTVQLLAAEASDAG